MTCEETRPRLTAMLDGELSEADAAQVQAHLAGCADCARCEAEFRAAVRASETWQVDAGDVWEDVRPQIVLTELAPVLDEMRLLRAELRALRAEVAGLRHELARRPPLPAPKPGEGRWPGGAPLRSAFQQGDDPWSFLRS